MFRSIQDFLGSWGYEAEATEKVLNNLTDESLSQQVTAEGRSLGRMAWHIVQTLPEMCAKTGLDVVGPAEDEAIPTSAAEIAGRFKEASDSLTERIGNSWTDADLDVEDEMYGQTWKRSMTLGALVYHQIHHRGQMTVLMRQAGLRVPGVYGPAKEEWAEIGAPAQE